MAISNDRSPRRAARLTPLLLAQALVALALVAPSRAQQQIFGIEINGTLCGFVEAAVGTERVDGVDLTVITQKVVASMTMLGNRVDTTVDMIMQIDPETGRWVCYRMRLDQGDTQIERRADVEGDELRWFDSLTGKERTVALSEAVIFEHPLQAPHLVRDLVEGGQDSATYPCFEADEGVVQEIRYTARGRETLDLAGRQIDTLIVDRANLVNGLTLRQWLDVDSGMAVRTEIPGGRTIELADSSVKKRLQLADMDPSIMHRVGVAIADVQAVESMQVRAVLAPVGLLLTAADLTVPGQRFEGSVTENRVDGVFTIEHRRYDGTDAPPFPAAFGEDPALQPFLRPEDRIESDDPALVAHARALTEGAPDSWQAARRLSAWVADNISYVIPGGLSARSTFDLRAGECGAHSLLLAGLCRAVDIPARVVWGCMYVPTNGGGFGQHAWNEIWMGEAGWVPVDSTAYEIDFVDSSHLRVGIYQSAATAINMEEMEILGHRVTAARDVGAATADFEDFIGEFAHPAGADPFVVRVEAGVLGVDIPGQVFLLLKDPDEQGRRYARLTNRVYCTFPRAEDGHVAALTIHEIVDMPRRGDPDAVPDAAPVALRPLLGTYRLPARRADFEVIFVDGGLAVREPGRDEPIGLRPLGAPADWPEGRPVQWIDEFEKNSVSFVVDPDGSVRALRFDTANRFERIGGLRRD